MLTKLIAGLTIAAALMPNRAFAEVASTPTAAPVAQAPATQIKPYRTFVTIQSYVMESNGDAQNPISNVRLEVKFPTADVKISPEGTKLELPEGGQYWPIGNGQTQEINRTFEIPWASIQNDGFNFVVQMQRKGSKMLPCNFKVDQLSQYNRAYTCHTDIQWQLNNKVKEDRLDKEGIQIRVFTDRNTPAKQMPKDSIALR